MEMDNSDIVIVGGGICGLATALALHRKGVPSLVLERSKQLRTTGAAIIIRHNGWRALDHLGIASKLRPTAIPLHSMQTFLSSLHLTDLRHRAPWNLLRSRLHRGTVTVAGDAMHAMGPFTAQGGCASLEDAVVLARSLADKMAGIIRDTSSKAVRFIAIALMAIFFPNPNACADYDCGHL